MLKIKEPFLKDLENSAQIFNSLADIPGGIDDVDALFDIAMEVGGVSRYFFSQKNKQIKCSTISQ